MAAAMSVAVVLVLQTRVYLEQITAARGIRVPDQYVHVKHVQGVVY